MPDSPAEPLQTVHLVQILVRQQHGDDVVFLLHPHETWKPAGGGETHLVFPTRKTIADVDAETFRGTPIEDFVDPAMREIGLGDDDFVLEKEIDPAEETIPAVHSGVTKHFVVYPVDVWVAPELREAVREKVTGVWLTAAEALAHPRISPTAHAVIRMITAREAELDKRYAAAPHEEEKDEVPKRLLIPVPERPSMHGLACKWFAKNRGGVRHLPAATLREILETGPRAFNLRVADPYLRYQRQGIGFTWSFFTHKDGQDIHVHSAPSVEIYGVLEGRLLVWWKPYHDQGTAAWSHRILGPGDWIEVDALHCHAVRWEGEGKGVVFKAGPGPLAGVGRLGVAGKTKCEECICKKPGELLALEKR